VLRLVPQDSLTVSDLKRFDAVGDSCDIQQAIKLGVAQVFYAEDDTIVVLEVDEDSLIILAVLGHNGIAMMQTLIEIAWSMRLSFVWYCSKRRGMQRLLKSFNPVPHQNGYRIRV
jgi:hypothetical protein